ncbi:MAG: GGDEF domain-containing protein, partial [Lachnospiraceae bacterium]|nr:GGDEF domain-containing protein [Lachnospiraceae bacterium]
RRLKLFKDGSTDPTIVQLNVYPLKQSGFYIFTMDELADEYKQEFLTRGKVNTIQSTYLFSMYVDLNENTINSISVSEVSDETVNGTMKYTDWRLMIVNMIWPEDKDRFLSLTDPEYLRANLEPGRTTSIDCQMANLEGKFIWVKLIFSRARTINEDDFRFVFMVQDINDDSLELLATLKKYEEQATYDSLTGLLNRATTKAQICNAIEKVKEEGRPLSLMMLDLDFFKDVNDKYGHFAGDATLKRFASILMSEMEGLDAAVGRWGGEEFIIACPGKTLDFIKEKAEHLRKAVEDSPFVDVGHITCSIGVTEVNKTDSFEDAFERVDKALYASKEGGRNRVTVL